MTTRKNRRARRASGQRGSKASKIRERLSMGDSYAKAAQLCDSTIAYVKKVEWLGRETHSLLNSGLVWEESDLRALALMYESGTPIIEIAEALGRSRHAIETVLTVRGVRHEEADGDTP